MRKLTCEHNSETACPPCRAAHKKTYAREYYHKAIKPDDRRAAQHRAHGRRAYQKRKETDPALLSDAARLWWEANRWRRKAYNRRAYLKQDPEVRRAYTRKWHGISDAERAPAVFAAQGCMCAICGRTTPNGKGWHADHDHATGLLRGVLCHSCNSGLGNLNDSEEILTRAIAYLRNPPAKRGR